EGCANTIDLPDNSADVVSAMGVMYHVLKRKQPAAFAEIKRILRPEGVFVLATSGSQNKLKHREIEKKIAETLSVPTAEPKLMNAGFNTETAEQELPKYFKNVYMYEHRGEFVIDSREKIQAYLNSLRSLRDQFDPVPSPDEFEQILTSVAMPRLEHEIFLQGKYTDVFRRSVF